MLARNEIVSLFSDNWENQFLEGCQRKWVLAGLYGRFPWCVFLFFKFWYLWMQQNN